MPRALRFLVLTFGCQMNVHDSDRMTEVLLADGWEPVGTPEEADLVVFNTCSVREKAEQKLRSEVGKLAPLKASRPDLVVAVAGCVAQQEGEALLSRAPHLDLVIGPDNLLELPSLVRAHRDGGPPLARTRFDLAEPHFLSARPELSGKRSPIAFVTTMKGCDERCSFCIVPTTRGPERYRPAQQIVDDARAFVSAGAREIVLLGQTVDSFRDPLLPPSLGAPSSEDPSPLDPDESQFPDLLRLLAREVPGLRRLRYTSPHPRHATPSLVRAHAELRILASHVHMPVQSGSDRVLRRMIRRYTRAEYIERVTRLRDARPGSTLSSDVIVGFPGETDDDFDATLSLVREMNFVQVYAFKFSPRPGTPALKLKDDVPDAVKTSRLKTLLALVEDQGSKHLASLVGTTATVLVEGRSKKGEALFQGRTERNEIVHLELEPARLWAGAMIDVRITRAHAHSLAGDPLSLPDVPLASAASRPVMGAQPRAVRLPLAATS